MSFRRVRFDSSQVLLVPLNRRVVQDLRLQRERERERDYSEGGVFHSPSNGNGAGAKCLDTPRLVNRDELQRALEEAG